MVVTVTLGLLLQLGELRGKKSISKQKYTNNFFLIIFLTYVLMGLLRCQLWVLVGCEI